jgi:hypothetical protein
LGRAPALIAITVSGNKTRILLYNRILYVIIITNKKYPLQGHRPKGVNRGLWTDKAYPETGMPNGAERREARYNAAESRFRNTNKRFL